MKIAGLKITADRWPWQGYGWLPHKNGKGQRAPLNPAGSRFGGGWNWKLGVSVGGRSVIVDLLFGIVRIDRVGGGK